MKSLLIVGWGRAGKDASGEYLGLISKLRYAGSTSWAGKEYVAEKLGIHPMVAWETRHQRRQEWKDLLDEYRRENGASSLMKKCLYDGEIVVGIRDKTEIIAARYDCLFSKILWVDRPGTPPDPTVTFTRDDCDDVIHNNGDLEDLKHTLRWVAAHLGILKPAAVAPTTDTFRE